MVGGCEPPDFTREARLAEAEERLAEWKNLANAHFHRIGEAEALLERVAFDVGDSFATRAEYPTLCDDIDAFLTPEKP